MLILISGPCPEYSAFFPKDIQILPTFKYIIQIPLSKSYNSWFKWKKTQTNFCGHKMEVWLQKNGRTCFRDARDLNSSIRSLFRCPISTIVCLGLNLSFYTCPSRLRRLTQATENSKVTSSPLMHNPQERTFLSLIYNILEGGIDVSLVSFGSSAIPLFNHSGWKDGLVR